MDISIISLLRLERQKRGWSLPYLGVLTGIHARTLGSWEREGRHPSIKQVAKWASVFNLKLTLVANGDTPDYVKLNDVLASLATLAELHPYLDEMIEGLRVHRELISSILADENGDDDSVLVLA